MKNSKIVLYEEGTNRHLPADLWPEILSRLPVKSLLRFRCVSKSWLSMITDPGFCRLHLENFKNNRDETQLLVLQAHGGQLNCVLRCSDTFETNAEVVHTLGRRYKEEGWNIEYTIDGLVLLRSYTRDLMDWVSSELMDWSCKLRLWNPSIRKFHDIPPLPETGEYDKSSLDEHIIGLGYDPLCKDYKYVELIFSYIRDEILCCSAVYTLGTRLWKITPFQFPGCFNRHSRVISPVEDTTVYFQGSIYFIVYHLIRSVLELVSVDLSSEVFSCTSLPDCGCYSESVSGPLTVVDDGCSLALFDGQCGTMWVLDSSSAETKLACWSRRYSFCFHILDFYAFKYHKKNGEILRLGEAKTPISMTLTDEQWDLLSSYNLETKRQKILFHSPRDFTVHNIYGYVESLIMLK